MPKNRPALFSGAPFRVLALFECETIPCAEMPRDPRMDAIQDRLAALERRPSQSIESAFHPLAERISKVEGQILQPKTGMSGLSITLVGVLAAAFITYLGWVGSEIRRIGIDIATLRVQVAPLVVSRDLSKIAAEKPEAIARALPKIREYIKTAEAGKVALNPKDLYAVKSTLAEMDRSTPDFWPATLDLIAYLSRSVSPSIPAYTGRFTIYKDIHGSMNVNGGRIELGGHIGPGGIIRNSLVKFDDDVVLDHVTFENCAFVFDVVPTPSPAVQRLGEMLLSVASLSEFTSS